MDGLTESSSEIFIKVEAPEETIVKEEQLEEESSEKGEFLENDPIDETLEPNEDLGVVSNEDPLEPTLRKQPLGPQAKLMILNVHKFMTKFRLEQARITGEDMNVIKAVADATGVSDSSVKKIIYACRNQGIERAIRPPYEKTSRKRKTDVIVGVDEAGKSTNKRKPRAKKNTNE